MNFIVLAFGLYIRKLHEWRAHSTASAKRGWEWWKSNCLLQRNSNQFLGTAIRVFRRGAGAAVAASGSAMIDGT